MSAQWKTDFLWVLQALLSLFCPLAHVSLFPSPYCLWFTGAND